ncbi:MAG TPA: 2-oxoglutarate and iron-dependent oxygenase domain-containing protein, partial [Gaiellales bacterium]
MPDAIEIPVIDLAPFLAGAPEGADVVRAIRSACEQIGFFCITGHGVPDATIERIKERSRAFFDQADAAKRRSAPPGTVPGGVTYSPVASEALAASRG